MNNNKLKWFWLLVIFFCISSQAFSDINYYVSGQGNDQTGNGTIDNPWATIYKAKQVVRTHISAGLSENIFINFRQGIYFLDTTVNFTHEDSGTNSFSIVYRSYPGEYAVLSGGFELDNWTEETGGKWSVTIPEAASGQSWFRQLWMNDTRCIRSRWPNSGTLETIKAVSQDKKDITLYSNIPGGSFAASKTEIVAYHKWSCGKSLLTSKLSSDTVRCQVMPGSAGLDKVEPQKNYQAYLEHNPDFIDQATEWYLDRATGKLTWLAPTGINPNREQMIASGIEKLTSIQGQSSEPVKNVLFLNLGFAHTYMPLPDFGYGGLQAGHFGPSYSTGPQYILPFAIEMKYAENIMVANCRFSNMGTGGIAVGIGSKYVQVKQNTFEDIGCTAVMTGWRGSADWSIQNCGPNLFMNDWSNLNDRPQYCSVSNNYVHNAAAEYSGCVAIWEGFCLSTNIKNNYVNSAPYSGINAGFTWNTQPVSFRAPIISNNHVSNVMQILNDGGGIYHLGNSAGGIIKDNIVHDVHGGAKQSMSDINFGYYFDQGSTNVTYQNNAAWQISSDCLYISQRAGLVHDTGDNLCNPDPLPDGLIASAGLSPRVSGLNAELSPDCRNVNILIETRPWAKIAYAKCIETGSSFEHLVKTNPNGQFSASVPINQLNSGINTFEVQVYSPDDKLSVPISIQMNLRKELSCDNKLDLKDLAVIAENWNFLNQPQLSGLMGYWNFDEPSGETAYDSSGNNNHATISSASRITGIGGGALEFSATGYVQIPKAVFNTIDEELTLAFWQKGSVNQPAQQSIFAAQNSAGTRVLNIHLPWNNEIVYFDAGISGSSYDRLTKSCFAGEYKEKWNHWAFTKNADTGTMKVYLNGELWASQSGMDRSMSGISAATIGAYRDGALEHEGIVDEFRIYNRELTADEINSLYLNNELYPAYPDADITGDHSVTVEDLTELVQSWMQD